MLIERQKLANEQILLRQERGQAPALVRKRGDGRPRRPRDRRSRRSSPHEVAVTDTTGNSGALLPC
jgi:hypothetical protein